MAEAPLEVVRACRLGLGGIIQFWCRGERLVECLGALLKSRQGTLLRMGKPGEIHYAVLTGSAGPVDEVLVAWNGWGAEVNCHGGSASALAVLALLREAGFAEISPRAWFERASFPPGHELEAEICPLFESAVTPLQVRLLTGVRAFAREVRVLRDSFLAGGGLAQVQDTVTRWRAFAPFAACGLKRHTVAIAGAPNVGKSTLFNRLLNSDRAMVSDLPGTTRDAVRHPCEVEGLEVELIDTAGLLAGARGADEVSVRRSREILKNADLRLLLFDGSRPISGEDRDAWALCAGLPLVTGVNKADLACAWDPAAFEAFAGSCAPVFISAQSGLSLSPLLSRVGGVLWGGLREEVKAGDTGPLTLRQVECCRRLEEGWQQGSDRVIREAFDQLLQINTGERDIRQWEERRRR